MKIDQEPPCAVATDRSNVFYKHNRPWALLPGECERALQALRRNLGALKDHMLGAGADPRSNPQTWDEHAVGCANHLVTVLVATGTLMR